MKSSEREPKKAKSADSTGERREKEKDGVGMGKEDKLNDGNKGERVVYEHKRLPHDQDD